MFDFAILGGGPAGCSAAIVLARAGCRVAVLERSEYDSPRPGEMLAPRAIVPLCELGVWPMERAAKLPVSGVDSAWGSSAVESTEFLMGPYGNGWHLDRIAFDRTLMLEARHAGAAVFAGCRGTSIERSRSRTFRLHTSRNGRSEVFEADRLIAATGRNGLVPGPPVSSRVVVDRLVGLSRTFETSDPTPSARTLIESGPNGWWYAAALPNRTTILTYCTDSDLIRCRRGELNAWFDAELAHTHWTKQVSCGAEGLSEIRMHSAHSGFFRGANDRCIAIGDTASSYDPLCGQGIAYAIDSGIEAARTLLAGGQSLTHSEQRMDRFRDYLQVRRSVYGFEKRWASNPFWRRRAA